MSRRGFELELQKLPREAKARYRRQYSEFTTNVKRLQTDLGWHKADGQRKVLFEGRSAPEQQDADKMGGDQIITATGGVQDNTMASLARQKRLLGEAEEVPPNYDPLTY